MVIIYYHQDFFLILFVYAYSLLFGEEDLWILRLSQNLRLRFLDGSAGKAEPWLTFSLDLDLPQADRGGFISLGIMWTRAFFPLRRPSSQLTWLALLPTCFPVISFSCEETVLNTVKLSDRRNLMGLGTLTSGDSNLVLNTLSREDRGYGSKYFLLVPSLRPGPIHTFLT
jgi:hypothetical protein